MNEIIVHIGLHKTASTFLQTQFFPFLDNAEYLNLTGTFNDIGKMNLQEKNLVISNEAFSGLPWNEKWQRGLKNDYSWIETFELSVRNLKILFPEATIVIVFRQHGDLLVSLYKQYIQQGGVLRFSDFYQQDGIISDTDLDFRRRIELLKKLFHKVYFLSFEDFKVYGGNYFTTFFSYIGMQNKKDMKVSRKANPGIRGNKIELLRRINKPYSKLPRKLRSLLRYTGIAPRNILQDKTSFWNTEDPPYLKETARSINEKFRKDWEFFQAVKWQYTGTEA